MKFQLIRKYSSTWRLITAAWFGLTYCLETAYHKQPQPYPKHHHFISLLAA